MSSQSPSSNTNRKNAVVTSNTVENAKEEEIIEIETEVDENAIVQTFQDFADVSTVHGLHYILKKDQNWLCRFFWFITVGLGCGLASYWSYLTWNEWNTNPILTSVSSTGLPLRDIEYPAIVICTQGVNSGVSMKATAAKILEYNIENGLDTFGTTFADIFSMKEPALDYFLKNSAKEWLEETFPCDKDDCSNLDFLYMADLLISKVPDTSIRAKVASQGGYDPCDEGSTPSRYKRSANFGKSIQTNCPIGTVKNPNALWCYRVTNFSDIDQCSDDVFEPLLFYNEMEVKGFMELLKTHSLNITTQGIALQAWRNQNNEFAFDGGYVSINDSFTATMEIIDDDISHSCIEARFDHNNASKLKLYSYDCPYETSGVVCQMYSNQQVSCNSDGSSSSTGSPSGGSSPAGGSSSGSSSSSSTGIPSTTTTTSTTSGSSQSSSWGNSPGSSTQSSGSSQQDQGSGSGPNYARNKRNVGNYEDENNDDGSGFESHDPLELMMNPELQTEFKKSINLLRKTMKDAFAKINMTQWYDGLFSVLWYNRSPCFDIRNTTSGYEGEWSVLKECKWKGVKVPCSAIFTTFPTDRGMCCAFNMKKADEIFEDSRYTQQVRKHQERDKNMSFGVHTLPKWYEPNNEPIARDGIHEGLSILIDSHDDWIGSSTVDEDHKGFVGYVSSGVNFPLTAKKGFHILGGHVNNVILKAYDVKSAPDIQSIEPRFRKCLFPRERKLKLYKSYSQSCCLLECKLQFAQSRTHFNCTPWYFPTQDQPIQMCDPWQSQKMEQLMFRDIPPNQCHHCHPDCSETVYSTSVTVAPFRRCDLKNLGVSHLCDLASPTLPQPRIWGHQVIQEYKEKNKMPDYIQNGVRTSERRYVPHARDHESIFISMNDDDTTGTYMAYEKDVALVNFYFDSSTVIQYYRERRLTFTSFVSQIGGLLGLCLGFSMVSIVELLYWCSYRLIMNLSNRKYQQNNDFNRTSPLISQNNQGPEESYNAAKKKQRGVKFFSIAFSHPVHDSPAH